MQLAEARALARLARRNARHQWKRTALIVAIIALPVAASQVTAGMIAAGRVTPAERTASELGTADVKVSMNTASNPAVEQWVDAELARLAPAAKVTSYRSVHLGVRVAGGVTGGIGPVSDIDLTDPSTSGRYGLTDGRLPTAVGEIAISEATAVLLDVGLGDHVTLAEGAVTDGRPLEVVGLIRDVLSRRNLAAIVSPAEMDLVAEMHHAWLETHRLVGGEGASRIRFELSEAWERSRAQFLPEPAVSPRPVALLGLDEDTYVMLTADEIAELVAFASANPPSPDDGLVVHQMAFDMINARQGWSMLPYVWAMSSDDMWWGDGGALQQPVTLGTAIAALLMAEVALVAGAAYATGTRRRLRELGLMSVNGATTQHLRWTVIGEGAVAGILGATIGTGIAVVAMTSGRPIMQGFVERLIIGFPLSPIEMAGPAIVGVAAAVVAAWVPARTAARVPATTALQGRMPLTSTPRWMVPLGLGVAGFGAFLLAVARTAFGDTSAVQAALGVILVIAGFALLAGPIVAHVGTRADRFRATTRLMLRDSARQRTRAATAVAATMVVLAAPVVLAVAIGTEGARQEMYGLRADASHVYVTPGFITGGGGQVQPEAVRLVTGVLPEADLVAVVEYDTRALLAGALPGGADPRSFSTNYEDDPRSVGVAGLTPELGAALAIDADVMGSGSVIVLGTKHGALEVVIGETTLPAIEVPAHVLEWVFPRVLVPEDIAASTGLAVGQETVLLINSTPLSDRQRLELSQTGVAVWMSWDTGLTGAQIILIGGGIALLVVLLIVGLVTALSATESDHDLRAMVAIGAPPRLRRSFLGLQSAYYTLFAALLAAPLALLLMKVAVGDGFVSQGPFGTMEGGYILVPWLMILAVVVGAPLVVGTVTALAVRSAPTMPPLRVR